MADKHLFMISLYIKDLYHNDIAIVSKQGEVNRKPLDKLEEYYN